LINEFDNYIAIMAAIRNDLKNIKINDTKIEILTVQHELFKQFGLKEGKLPYNTAHVTMEIVGVSVSVVNAIRRTLLCEMTGYALNTTFNDPYQDQDLFITAEFINERLSLIPLKLQIDQTIIDEVSFYIDIENYTDDMKTIYSSDIQFTGKLTTLLFNPTFPLAKLNPGKRLLVKNIRIEEGIDNAKFQASHNVVIKNLDIARNDDIEMSGYEISTLVADSTQFLLEFNVANVRQESEVKIYFNSAIKTIIARIRRVMSELETSVVDLDDDFQRVTFGFADTRTISELFVRTAFDLTNNQIKSVRYKFDEETHISTIEMTHKKVLELTEQILQRCIDVFEKIQI